MHTTKTIHRLLGLSLLAALAGAATMAQAEQAWGRVISATPVAESTGNTGYSVTYEYGGRQYTTRTDTHPGANIPLEVGSYGVATTSSPAPSRSSATTSPVAPQPRLAPRPVESAQSDAAEDWNDVVPEPGVVVSGGGAPAPVYVQPAPIYYPAPVYVQPSYAYPRPYVYPPVGISLNLGYSRGWGRGWHGGAGWHGRWHGGHRHRH